MVSCGLAQEWNENSTRLPEKVGAEGDYVTVIRALRDEVLFLEGISEEKMTELAYRLVTIGSALRNEIEEKRGIHRLGLVIYRGPTDLTPEDLVGAAVLCTDTANEFMRRFPGAENHQVADCLKKIGLVATTPVKESLWEVFRPFVSALDKAF